MKLGKLFLAVGIIAPLGIHGIAIGQQKRILPSAKTSTVFRRSPKRPVIKFVPFEMVDAAGRPIPSNRIVKLPNGKSVTARAYFDSLNRIEQGLNSVGYSMRDEQTSVTVEGGSSTNPTFDRQIRSFEKNLGGGSDHIDDRPSPLFEAMTGKGSKGKVSLSKSDLKLGGPHGMLIAPKSILDAIQKKPPTITSPSVSSGRQTNPQFGGGKQKGSDTRTGTLKQPLGYQAPITFTAAQDFPFGNNDFGAHFGYRIDAKGTALTKSDSGSFSDSQSEFNTSISGIAGVTLMSNKIDLVTVKANFSGSDVSRKVHFGLNVFVGGFALVNENDDKVDSFAWHDGYSAPFIEETPEFKFPVFGPFQVVGKAGVMGEAGVKLTAAIFTSHIQAEANPYVRSKAYAEIGVAVDLEVASAQGGIHGDLTLLNDDLKIGANVGVGYDQNKREFQALEEIYCHNSFEALNGTLSFYARVYGLFGVLLHEWTFPWTSWRGFQSDKSLLDKVANQPLNWH